MLRPHIGKLRPHGVARPLFLQGAIACSISAHTKEGLV